MDKNSYRISPSLKMEEQGGKIILHWKDPSSRRMVSAPAGPDELLGLKIVTENLSLQTLARRHQVPLSKFYRLLSLLDRKGILQAPSTLLRRDEKLFPKPVSDDLTTNTVFGIQWHITNSCDMHCRHCYDRSRREAMSYSQAIRVLEELETFCQTHWVTGDISFTGGNPFLYKDFLRLYRAAVKRSFAVSILGNPVPEETLDLLCAIQKPDSYQISLEGLAHSNDAIRGFGSYQRGLRFLKTLREKGIQSSVMMTVTQDNLDQVIPLARALEDKVDSFNFNRLSRVGEGAALQLPNPQAYRRLLQEYIQEEPEHFHWSLKENLINLCLSESGQELSTGCTGVGCGAAFNFLAVLPDGEVHACRKFPSLLGNLKQQSLDEIYFSKAAHRYRRGFKFCDGCEIRSVCGGCLAAKEKHGPRLVSSRDPFCWKSRE